ncbi:hypothetical protein [Edaphosphingomonas haloaromaticamans]|uniref:hypothetical protein n=1 Tax=Edaphosphingomonas haloaromaticamans TaxID=653954 RepID=UPI0011135948|nr:hypothetical protein [Sphingomonas haloaromaticamans]
MPPADIKQFRKLVRTALEEAGFVAKRLEPKMPLAWTLPASEIVPTFLPHEMRRPWGYHLSGTLGIELPALTTWLAERFSPNDRGVFRHCFVSYHIANDALLNDLSVIHSEEVPASIWVDRLKDRFSALPSSLDDLCDVYRRSPDHLSWFSAPMNKSAWDFLLRWRANPKADLTIPKSLF